MKQVIDFKRLPDRFRSFAARVIPVLILLHTYIGWQLLPVMPLPSYSMAIGIILLASSCFLTPLGLFARFVVVVAKG